MYFMIFDRPPSLYNPLGVKTRELMNCDFRNINVLQLACTNGKFDVFDIIKKDAKRGSILTALDARVKSAQTVYFDRLQDRNHG